MRTAAPFPARRLALGAIVILALISPAFGAKIEAVKGKQYTLTKDHGPWMIMVASFKAPPPELRVEGLSPKQAADELVWELRKKGIPAYTFSQESVVDTVETQDRLMRQKIAMLIAQQGSVCVLAGNYSSADDDVAQKTLDYVKRFHPEFLREEDPAAPRMKESPLKRLKNGGVLRLTPGQPGPLTGAFLTINPLLTPEEAHRRKKDPLLIKLNYGAQFSLADNPGRYSVVVATFTGKTLTTIAGGNFQQVAAEFDAETGSALDQAADEARQLAKYLRSLNREAWVWHDRYSSVVTIGSFDDPQDPRVRQTIEFYAAKKLRNPETGQEHLHIEYAMIPGDNPKDLPKKTWPYDPEPRLIEVPRLN